jgi:hypothetical protein
MRIMKRRLGKKKVDWKEGRNEGRREGWRGKKKKGNIRLERKQIE